MCKKHNGYFTIEAAFILPVVLFLYLLIILAALFLYCRCVISQDDFLLGMRAGRFTWGENDYGEVIYGNGQENTWSAEGYVEERLADRKQFYPFYPAETGQCRINKETIIVQTTQKGSKNRITKVIQRVNPVQIIREGRKNDNA